MACRGWVGPSSLVESSRSMLTHGTRYDFDQNEVVLCMESVVLESTSSLTGFKDFIAVGTGFNFGEDRASRGNVSCFCSNIRH